MFRADLHCHTTFSDGTLTPCELLLHAKEIGLTGISITDHDTIGAYGEAVRLAKELGLLLGTGVEFSSVFHFSSVHILGYDFDLNSSAIAQLCARHEQRRIQRNEKILVKLAKAGMPISEEELVRLGGDMHSVGRPHIAQLMVNRGYVSSIRHAFDLHIGDGKPCFDPGEGISSAETIDVIHAGGGKAFLAHPHLLDSGRQVRELLELSFDGIECYYARCSFDQEKRWLKVAKERGWLVSGGSDFHGSVKEHIPLGCSWVDEERFRQIFQRTA